MRTKDVKNGEPRIRDGDPLLSIEIGMGGIQRVLIFHADGDGLDEQTEAHLLLAKIMAQLMLLDDAVKTTSRGISVSSK